MLEGLSDAELVVVGAAIGAVASFMGQLATPITHHWLEGRRTREAGNVALLRAVAAADYRVRILRVLYGPIRQALGRPDPIRPTFVDQELLDQIEEDVLWLTEALDKLATVMPGNELLAIDLQWRADTITLLEYNRRVLEEDLDGRDWARTLGGIAANSLRHRRVLRARYDRRSRPRGLLDTILGLLPFTEPETRSASRDLHWSFASWEGHRSIEELEELRELEESET